MLKIKSFVFNPFQQNTYVLSDETKECIIIDPGCFNSTEEQELKKYIDDNGLKPVMLVLTHAHIDHVLGNHFVHHTYGLSPVMHKEDEKLLLAMPQVASMYGVPATPSPAAERFIDEGARINFGNTSLEIFFTPGHSPGSVCFYNKEAKAVIAGDVLFQGSIGRTDLPGGDFETLINSIKTKLFVLPDDVTVYSGHGNPTTIGIEKKTNPFLT